MISYANAVKFNSRQCIIATSMFSNFSQNEFAEILDKYLFSALEKSAESRKIKIDQKKNPEQHNEAITNFIHQFLSKWDNVVLEDDKLQYSQLFLVQFILQQWPFLTNSILETLKIKLALAQQDKSYLGISKSHIKEMKASEQTVSYISKSIKHIETYPCIINKEWLQDQKDKQFLPLVRSNKHNIKYVKNILPSIESIESVNSQTEYTQTYDDTPLNNLLLKDKFDVNLTTVPSILDSRQEAIIANGLASHWPINSSLHSILHLSQQPNSLTWQQSLGEHIVLMKKHGFFCAQLYLYPQELGMLKVSLRLNKENLQIYFYSENKQVRILLETAVKQLCASLAENGINIDDVSIGANELNYDLSDHTQDRKNNCKKQYGQNSILSDLCNWYCTNIDIYV